MLRLNNMQCNATQNFAKIITGKLDMKGMLQTENTTTNIAHTLLIYFFDKFAAKTFTYLLIHGIITMHEKMGHKLKKLIICGICSGQHQITAQFVLNHTVDLRIGFHFPSHYCQF